MEIRTREQIQAAEKYWSEATAFVKKMTTDPRSPAWFSVTREMPKHLEAWERYYETRLGFLPRGLEMLKAFKIGEFLVPMEWPEWFDAGAARAA